MSAAGQHLPFAEARFRASEQRGGALAVILGIFAVLFILFVWAPFDHYPYRSLPGAIESIAFSPDSRILATGSRGPAFRVQLWHVASGAELRALEATRGAAALAFSPDGRHLAAGGNDGVKVWEVATGREITSWSEDTGAVKALLFDSQGDCLAASRDGDRGVRVWNVTRKNKLSGLTHGSHPRAMAFSTDGRWLASGGEDTAVHVWEVATGRVVRSWTGHYNFVTSVAFMPGNKQVASGSRDRSIKLWDIESGREIRTLAEHPGYVEALSFHADGRRLAAGGGFAIVVWDPAGGRQVQTLGSSSRFRAYRTALMLQGRGTHRRWISAVAFSPDGKWLASAGRDSARLWSIEMGRTVHRFSAPEPDR